MPKVSRDNRDSDLLAGVCSSCGQQASLPLSAWRMARRNDSWPHCTHCGEWLYPINRKCRCCGAVLRNGNLGEHCAACERKRANGVSC